MQGTGAAGEGSGTFLKFDIESFTVPQILQPSLCAASATRAAGEDAFFREVFRMKYTGTTYRPPFESKSLLLQVTAGCSHNKCRFCTMYREIPFAVERPEQIEQDLREARRLYRHVERVFLVNGDPFVLPAERLKETALQIRAHLPEVASIGMYAAIGNIRHKTDAELRELRALGITGLNIGVESGLDAVLADLNKGFTAAEAEQELSRLSAAGMDFSLNIILGAGGRRLSREHARASSELVNRTRPGLVFVASLHIDAGCELDEDLEQGRFVEPTLRELLEEERDFLQGLDAGDTIFFGLHPSNAVPVYGVLSERKIAMLAALERGLRELPPAVLDSCPLRGLEGAPVIPVIS